MRIIYTKKPRRETNEFPDNKTYMNKIIIRRNKKLIGINKIYRRFTFYFPPLRFISILYSPFFPEVSSL